MTRCIPLRLRILYAREDLRQPLHCQELTLQGHEHVVRCLEGSLRAAVEVRRAVQDHIVEVGTRGELGIALGALANNPLFLGRDVGTPDVAAVVGMNFGVIPLPAAAPLFFAGLAGLGFAGRRKKKA